MSEFKDEKIFMPDDDSQDPFLDSQPAGIQLNDPELGFNAQAIRDEDGRVNIALDDKSSRFSQLTMRFSPDDYGDPNGGYNDAGEPPPMYEPPASLANLTLSAAPRMNIVIHVVGSRGDVQPFLALARVLKEKHGHHVRLATHPKFEAFVEGAGIEFFSIGGDPAELMDFMVKNASLIPSSESILNGDVGKKRVFMGLIAEGCWRSCIEPGPKSGRPFIADAIIANPPSFAHIHCAEKLSIPLHLMFTMPWTPSTSFPHPLANMQPSKADPQTANMMSFHLVEMLTWQGLGDVINKFRVKTLGLQPISQVFAPGLTWRLRVPFTYAWSPALLPKPKEWGKHITVSGYFTDPTHTSHTPSPELARFLAAGPPPIYIGFGSINFEKSEEISHMILTALERNNLRAIISRGWAKLGSKLQPHEIPDTVLFVDDTPHPWLFPQCCAVVHHGGAGTTACGLEFGRPSIVVPFFGDQWFWGDMINRRGAGPKPIPIKQLTLENLTEAMAYALRPECAEAALKIQQTMASENGCEMGAGFFHSSLKLNKGNANCAVYPDRIACWKFTPSLSGKKKSKSKANAANEELKLSALGAAVLLRGRMIKTEELEILHTFEYDSSNFNAPWDPVSGILVDTSATVTDLLKGATAGPREALRQMKGGSRQGNGEGSSGGQNGGYPPEKQGENGAQAFPSYYGKKEEKTRHLDPATSVAWETTKGIGKVTGAALKTPVTFTNGITRGFNNVPALYGDTTVRKEHKVDGVKSGFVAAGKGFGEGLFDGITGLVTQPYQGAKKEGALGALKGFGKGIGGVAFKPAAGAVGIVAHPFMGMYKSAKKIGGGEKTSLEQYLVSARLAQGEQEAEVLGQREVSDGLGRWGVEIAKRRV